MAAETTTAPNKIEERTVSARGAFRLPQVQHTSEAMADTTNAF